MKCPVDGATLVMTERSGVEIDYCPQCRGVWLDRGELDKLIERAAPTMTLQEPAREARRDDPARHGYAEPARDGYRDPRRDDHRGHDRDDDYHKRKRRKSFLDDIFDF